jgi:hypothetical protein
MALLEARISGRTSKTAIRLFANVGRIILKRLFRLFMTPILAIGVASAMLATEVAPSSAASVDAAVIQGSGTITPGLDILPATQSFTFTSATITTVGTDSGTSSCTASGGSAAPENLAAGIGTGGYSCSSGPLAGWSGALIYARVGAVVTVWITAGPGGVTVGAFACVFVAASAPPVTAYTLICVGTVVSV